MSESMNTPWSCSEYGSVADSTGDHVAHNSRGGNNRAFIDHGTARLRHAVACVNAFGNIPTADIEAGEYVVVSREILEYICANHLPYESRSYLAIRSALEAAQ